MPVMPVKVFVQRFAGVFFQMRARDADALDGAVVEHDVDMALADDGQFVLRNLVALGQVRVEIVLARKHALAADFGVNAQAELDGHAHGFLVQHRQHAGHAKVDQAGLRVGFGAEGGAEPEKIFDWC
jgi:hypothetical protein